MNLLGSLFIGGVAGWLAGRLMKGGGYGLFINILLGLLGGFVGDLVFGLLGLRTTNLVGNLLAAVVGAVLLIHLARRLRK
jgi:uncharacterized membrane protein YeaQ/YmgE (transglycosylase-associated protein family)